MFLDVELNYSQIKNFTNINLIEMYSKFNERFKQLTKRKQY